MGHDRLVIGSSCYSRSLHANVTRHNTLMYITHCWRVLSSSTSQCTHHSHIAYIHEGNCSGALHVKGLRPQKWLIRIGLPKTLNLTLSTPRTFSKAWLYLSHMVKDMKIHAIHCYSAVITHPIELFPKLFMLLLHAQQRIQKSMPTPKSTTKNHRKLFLQCFRHT